MYKYLFESPLSILLGIYPGVELLDHVAILCLTFGGTPYCFSQQLYHVTFPPSLSIFKLEFILCHSSPASPTHLHFPNIHPVYKVDVPVSLIRGGKKVALIVKSMVLRPGMAVGD